MPDPMALALEALMQNWAVGRLYPFSCFCLIMRCLAKLREEGGEFVLMTPWYSSLLEMSVFLLILLPWDPKLLQVPHGQSHPLESNPATRRLACVQRSLQPKGISSNAFKLILAAWRPGKNSVYNFAWKKWHCWFVAMKVDPLCPPPPSWQI